MASRSHVERAIEQYQEELARYPNVTAIGVVPVSDDSDGPADLAGVAGGVGAPQAAEPRNAVPPPTSQSRCTSLGRFPETS